jgi:hypothetical protein
MIYHFLQLITILFKKKNLINFLLDFIDKPLPPQENLSSSPLPSLHPKKKGLFYNNCLAHNHKVGSKLQTRSAN